MAKKDGVYIRNSAYYISWVDAQGRRRRRRTDALTLEQARSYRAAERNRVEQAKALGFVPPGTETTPEVALRFLAHQKARLTAKAYEREQGIVSKQIVPFFPGPLASVRRVDVQRFVTHRAGKVGSYSVQKELNVLKHFLRLCVEWELIPFSPGQGVKGPRVPAGRVRYLQPTELRAAISASPKWLQPIVAMAASTGMRRSEILSLRWLDVDLMNGRILLPHTKNGEGRIVYMNESAVMVLRSVPTTPKTPTTDTVFRGVTGEQVSMAFARVCRRLRIADFRFHDLRHTAASWLRMQGADIHTVAQLLGHKDLRMAARYQHLSPAFLADAVKRLDGIFGDLRHLGVTASSALPEGAAAND